MKKDKKVKEQNGEKKRSFPKIHVLDVVIVVLIIATVVGVYFRYNVFDTIGNLQNQNEAQITFVAKGIDFSPNNFIQPGDSVYFKNDGKNFGTMMASTETSQVAFITTPASESFITPDGKHITVPYPLDNALLAKTNAEGKIKCSGTFSEDGSFLLGGSTYIAAGGIYVICTEKVTLEITINSIEKIDS